MTSRDLVVSVEDGPSTPFSSISERCVYLYLRFHADRHGVLRLAMTELAAMLGVNRQTILKHVDTLLAKRLIRRQGHGRYVVYGQPWSVQSEISAYLDSLKPGAEADPDVVSQALYGRSGDDFPTHQLDGTPIEDAALWSEIIQGFEQHLGTRIRENRDSLWVLVR